MKSPKTFLLLGTVLGIFLISVAYAAIQNITLTVNGTATVTPDQSNFDVRISGVRNNWFTMGEDTEATASIAADGLSATITATGLKKVGDGVTTCLSMMNNSADLGADISFEYSVTNSEYFNVEVRWNGDSYIDDAVTDNKVFIGPNSAATGFIYVSITLKKLPITTDVSTEVTIDITAEPVN